MRSKSVRKTEGVGARFTGRGRRKLCFAVFRNGYLQMRPINRFIGGPVQDISITRYIREDFRWIRFDSTKLGVKLILDQDIERTETDDLCRYYFAAGH